MNKKHPDSTDFFTRVLNQRVEVIKFCILTLAIFTPFYILYNTVLVDLSHYNQYLKLVATLASQLLNQCLTDETFVRYVKSLGTIELHFNNLIYITLTKEADAFIATALLLSGIIAWPGELWKKFVAVSLGVLLMFSLNILRIACMLSAEIYHPLHFEMINDWVLSIILMVVAMLYFYLWVIVSGRHPDGAVLTTNNQSN